MDKNDLAFTPVSELRGLIDSRRVSIVELTETFLGRIEELNPRLNAYLTVTAEEAMSSARSSEQALLKGDQRGPLHGIPISIKDLEITKGICSTMGSLVFKDHIPDRDSLLVERVREAGAIVLGKTNTPEFGFVGTTENRLGDACRNPWDPERTPGGSSGGAASAVAAGLCPLATGSDGGGSIRIPCAFSGIFGIKPSQGRVPRHGGVGMPAHNNFSQGGPVTRTVRDSAILLQVMAGPDRRDPACMRQQPPDYEAALELGVKGLRAAWSLDLGYAAVDPEVAAANSKAAHVFEELGCTVDEAGLALEDPFPVFWDIFSLRGYTSFGYLLDDHRDELTERSIETLERGMGVTAPEYNRGMLYVEQLQARMEDLFEDHDLLLTPTLAVPAFPIEQLPEVIGGRRVNPFWGFTPFTYPFNMTMHTAASVPCGFSSDGLPIGLQIVGRRGDEATVLRAAAAFEAARPWAQHRPPVQARV